ncbi:MAG TPA: hypothetical protein VK548_20690 [Candidatus Acidoferrum sp.]|nr:hypothetical protein [Candidatus Acidoferrum sp.]
MRQFWLACPPDVIRSTVSSESSPQIRQTACDEIRDSVSDFSHRAPATAFPVPSSHHKKDRP